MNEFEFELRPPGGDRVRATFAWKNRDAVLKAAGMPPEHTIIKLLEVFRPDPDRYFDDFLRDKIGIQLPVQKRVLVFLKSAGFRQNRCFDTIEATWSPTAQSILFHTIGVTYITARTLVANPTAAEVFQAKMTALAGLERGRRILDVDPAPFGRYQHMSKWIDEMFGGELEKFRQMRHGDAITLTDGRRGTLVRINEVSAQLNIGGEVKTVPFRLMAL